MQQANDTIVPLVFSNFGKLNVDGLECLRNVAKSISAGDKKQYAVVMNRIHECMSVALWKGNAGIMSAFKAVINNIDG